MEQNDIKGSDPFWTIAILYPIHSNRVDNPVHSYRLEIRSVQAPESGLEQIAKNVKTQFRKAIVGDVIAAFAAPEEREQDFSQRVEALEGEYIRVRDTDTTYSFGEPSDVRQPARRGQTPLFEIPAIDYNIIRFKGKVLAALGEYAKILFIRGGKPHLKTEEVPHFGEERRKPTEHTRYLVPNQHPFYTPRGKGGQLSLFCTLEEEDEAREEAIKRALSSERRNRRNNRGK